MKKQINTWLQSLVPGANKKKKPANVETSALPKHTNFTNPSSRFQVLNNPAHQDLLNGSKQTLSWGTPPSNQGFGASQYNNYRLPYQQQPFNPTHNFQQRFSNSQKQQQQQRPPQQMGSPVNNQPVPPAHLQPNYRINPNDQSQPSPRFNQPNNNEFDSHFQQNNQYYNELMPMRMSPPQQYFPPTPAQPFYPSYVPENVKFNHEEVKLLLPKPIAREIITEKIRTILMMIFGSLGAIFTAALIAMYYVATKQGVTSLLGIETTWIPLPVFTISALVLCLALIIWGALGMHQILLEADGYLRKRRLGQDDVPQFIITNFKFSLRRKIVINWVFIPCYFLLAFILGFLIFLNNYKGQSFNIGFWSLGKVPNLTPGITVVAIIIASLLLIHLINLILYKKRTANIIGYFGSMVMSDQQIIEYKKRINRICLVCFIVAVILLFFLISIPILIFRRKKASGWKWPWSKS